jgi:hypothetical protein
MSTILFVCIGLAAALSLLSKMSSNQLYDECKMMSESELFEEMIKKLSHPDKIPILVEEGESAPWDDENYAKRLSAMQGFMAEVKSHNKVYRIYPSIPPLWHYMDGTAKKEQKLAYVRAERFRYEIHRVCCAIL